MNWIELTTEDQLEHLKAASYAQPIFIFKHSTRCSISRAVLDRLERNWRKEELADLQPYLLDLLAYRAVSNLIATEFGIEHESPQALVIYQGKPVYAQSHFAIDLNTLKASLPDQVKN